MSCTQLILEKNLKQVILREKDRAMKKLPIGIQTFSDIINENYVYVDKTEIALQLIERGRYYFLSRPRRFGKSLFLDTLKEIFEGKKELFKGLHIYDKWDFEDRYPVIKVGFTGGFYGSFEEIEQLFRYFLHTNEQALGVTCNHKETIEVYFSDLIKKVFEKYQKKVVILIDEYDKPILDNITRKERARAIRDQMKGFYSVIKGNDAIIRFVFLTGVSKFSKMNLFSGLNNLNDITLDDRFGNICGYTHEDLKTHFGEHLEGVDLEEVKKWYNGYNYFGDLVYNPFDILLFIDKGKEFQSYWWSTGNPSFLIDLLREKEYYIPNLNNVLATGEMLDSFDVDSIELEALLWQTGYLTITEKVAEPFGMSYRLGLPNKEVQTSLNSLYITCLTENNKTKDHTRSQMAKALMNGDTSTLKEIFTALFASIANTNFTKNDLTQYEGYYASVIYAYLASLGFTTIAEDVTNKGRIDLTLLVNDLVYILEFKVTDQADGSALRQIKERKYYEKYGSHPAIWLIGIEFSETDRNISNWQVEQVKEKDRG